VDTSFGAEGVEALYCFYSKLSRLYFVSRTCVNFQAYIKLFLELVWHILSASRIKTVLTNSWHSPKCLFRNVDVDRVAPPSISILNCLHSNAVALPPPQPPHIAILWCSLFRRHRPSIFSSFWNGYGYMAISYLTSNQVCSTSTILFLQLLLISPRSCLDCVMLPLISPQTFSKNRNFHSAHRRSVFAVIHKSSCTQFVQSFVGRNHELWGACKQHHRYMVRFPAHITNISSKSRK
jgi:hypothetical protein